MRLIKIEAKHCDASSTWNFNPIETYINIDLLVGIHILPNKYKKSLGNFYLLKIENYQDLEITEKTLNFILGTLKSFDRDEKINQILQ